MTAGYMRRDWLHEPEKQFQQGMVDAARRLGWLAFHAHDSRKSEPGFPDLVMLRGPRLIVAELKTERGIVTAEQMTWLDAFRRVPCAEVGVWRPSQKADFVRLLAGARP